jgi:hypothetical protein
MVPASVRSNSRTVSLVMQPGALVVNTLPGQDERAVAEYVMGYMADWLEQRAGR